MPGGRALDGVAQSLIVADVDGQRYDIVSRRLQPRVDGLKSFHVDVGEHDLRGVLCHHLRIGERDRAGSAAPVTNAT